MFTVNEYKIVFKKRWHDRRRPLSKKLQESKAVKMPETNGRYDTVCEIYVQDKSMSGGGFRHVYKEEPSFIGVAKLHPNDRPDKIVGKKIALRNAMGRRRRSINGKFIYEWNCANFYNKPIRTAIWDAFRTWVANWNNQPLNKT